MSDATQSGGIRRGFRLLHQVWLEIRLPLVLVAAVSSIVFGVIGWTQYLNARDIPHDGLDPLYLTIQLFTLQISGIPEAQGFSWPLQIARFLAPALTGYAAFQAFLAVFRMASQRLSVRFARDHVIICGLGDTGLAMVRALRRRNVPVVVIERDETVDNIEYARGLDATVVVGDGRDAELLTRIRVGRATHLLAVCGNDAINGEVAVTARSLSEGRTRGALDCRVHVGDLGLSSRLRTEELATRPTSGCHMDFFNVNEAGARTMLTRFAPFEPESQSARVALVGSGSFVQAATLELSRLWSAQRRGRPLDLVLAGPSARTSIDRLEAQFPGLGDQSALVARTSDLTDPELAAQLIRARSDTRIYVCIPDTTEGLAVGLRIADGLEDGHPPVVVLSDRDEGLTSLVIDGSPDDPPLTPFGLLDAACDPELLFAGLWESLAQAVHERYVAAAKDRGENEETNPSVSPWDALDETLRRSNREQARHIGVKLAAIDARPVPLVDAGRSDDQLTAEEIEVLAQLEHDRWVEERREDGWTPGPVKDAATKKSPHLVPWDELDEAIRELDREAVRSIPSLLALVGYRIQRVDNPSVPAPA